MVVMCLSCVCHVLTEYIPLLFPSCSYSLRLSGGGGGGGRGEKVRGREERREEGRKEAGGERQWEITYSLRTHV